MSTDWKSRAEELEHECELSMKTIAAERARAEAAEARLEAHIAYSCDLQRIIEDICHGREIRTPKTVARWHYDMAVDYRVRLTTAVAEAIWNAPAKPPGPVDPPLFSKGFMGPAWEKTREEYTALARAALTAALETRHD